MRTRNLLLLSTVLVFTAINGCNGDNTSWNHHELRVAERVLKDSGGAMELARDGEFKGQQETIKWTPRDLRSVPFQQVVNFRTVKYLYISGCLLSSDQKLQLGKCIELETLVVDGCNFTTADVSHLLSMPKLKWLSLNRCDVSNDILLELARCKTLQDLFLDDTDVTQEGVAHYRESGGAATVFWSNASPEMRRALWTLEQKEVFIKSKSTILRGDRLITSTRPRVLFMNERHTADPNLLKALQVVFEEPTSVFFSNPIEENQITEGFAQNLRVSPLAVNQYPSEDWTPAALHKLLDGSQVEELELSIDDCSTEHLAVLENINGLKILRLAMNDYGKGFTPEMLQLLHRVPTLELLEIRKGVVSEEAMLALSRHLALKKIVIWPTVRGSKELPLADIVEALAPIAVAVELPKPE